MSSDLLPLDFFFWTMEDHMSETPFDREMDLVAWIIAAVGIVSDKPGCYRNIRRSMQQCCEFCTRVNDCYFEHLLRNCTLPCWNKSHIRYNSTELFPFVQFTCLFCSCR
ncbi:hypothetical protein TNCT_260701 [Trichonephila clavata]|uniref:Uncharacterized protein n=1 Tax=Trichonephila clavata TaxID=2740835 RepID=A0A8X6IGZ8_TRICU|nr:hypothetical protein TNCT_260701 [Trichonephila clavata]